MLNSVCIQGRFVDFPLLKTTTSGKSVVSFTLAVNDNYTKDKTYFIDMVAWGKTAEHINTYYSKGSLIAIEGELQTRTYQDKNGSNRKVTEVVVKGTHFCEKKQSTAENVPAANTSNNSFEEIDDDSDLPF